ncbi:glycosyl hydrolase family 61-domain-containing protein [Boletus coccyginus]|nr:glycosyl hydrolase family 61-domain-containing protein [Boletus coccyginus]
MIASTLLSLLLPALVSAHGYVNKVTIDGTAYPGNAVGTSSTISSAIRQVNTNSPVKGATSPDLNCGPGAQLAAESANANPGSTVEVSWVGGTSGSTPWPHNVGPLMFYMAQCQGSCSTYDSSGAKWFKIAEQGYQSGSTWYQAELQSGSPSSVTIPSTLAAGNYLLRSEVISLQNAMSQGGAEFYPSCIQFPRVAKKSLCQVPTRIPDPGILVNVYSGSNNYTFPGPPVCSLSGGSGSGSSGGSGTGSSGGSGTGSSGGSGSSSASAKPSPSGAPSPASSVTASSASSVPSSPAGAGGYPPASSPTVSPTAAVNAVGYSPSSTPPAGPSAPGGAGGNPPASAPSATPSSTPTEGSGSTCANKRSIPDPHVIVDSSKRMHRRRYRTSH